MNTTDTSTSGAHFAQAGTTLVQGDAGAGDFLTLNRLTDWLKTEGFSVGSMERHSPVGILKARGVVVSKWSGMSMDERRRLDGYITTAGAERFRDAEYLRIVWREAPAAAPLLLDLRAA